MTDDDLFFAAVCKQFGRPVPPAEAPDKGGFVTAAVITKPKLVLTTVEHPAHTRARFDEQRSRIFELSDRSARSVEGLLNAVSRFVKDQKIAQVFLRAQSERGKYPGDPLNFKIEAVLQLVPGLQVTFVNKRGIGAWARREDPVVPAGQPGLGAYWTEKQRLAIETALFVARNYDNPKCFSDGSADHD
jgi:hypothetical protein